VSEGCEHCYAMVMSNRNPKVLGTWGPKGTRVLAASSQWRQPVNWARTAGCDLRVFCASLADVFEDWPGQMSDSQGNPLWHYPGEGGPVVIIPGQSARWAALPYTLDDARARLWKLIRATPELTWMLLTKRPENIATMMPKGDWPNVWLGTSVECQEYIVRLDILQDAPQVVPVRFASVEPQLEHVNLRGALAPDGINWVIVGGESGHYARPFNLAWAMSLVGQCDDAGVACFVKQAGARPMVRNSARELIEIDLPGKGDDPVYWPEWMRVRQVPVVS